MAVLYVGRMSSAGEKFARAVASLLVLELMASQSAVTVRRRCCASSSGCQYLAADWSSNAFRI